jgi:dTMP kinase
MAKGKYIVIEGADGSGKTTMARNIQALLFQKLGIKAVILREPGSTEFADKIREVLKSTTSRSPEANVLAFNAARADTMREVAKHIENGGWVIADRSWISTVVYQGYGEGLDIDNLRRISQYAAAAQADLTVVLDAPVDVRRARNHKRGGSDYFENQSDDFHERVRQGYLKEAEFLGLPLINANDSESSIATQLWGMVEEITDIKSKTKKTKRNPFVEKTEHGMQPTELGNQWLGNVLSNPNKNAYVFNNNLSPITIAAAMARLSRRADDMRVTILDEFSQIEGKDDSLLRRVITAYGDDSVQQLTGIHAVVENASNLLTKKLEWGRLAAYLEQSTRYIYYDRKTREGKYRYYTPTEFDESTTKIYNETLDQIFDLYSIVVHELTDFITARDETPKEERDIAWKGAIRAQACDVARAMLPVATTSTVGLYASGQAYESLVMHLMSDELEESRATGEDLLEAGRTVAATFLERADKPSRGGAMQAYRANTRNAVAEITEKLLSKTGYSDDKRDVHLVSTSMRNELDVVPYILYEASELSLDELQKEVADWSYDKKLEVFNAYIGERLNRRHKPGRAFEHIEYNWDIMCDYGIFRDLQRHRMVEGLQWQKLTPRYGYETPKLIEDANLTEAYDQAFELSQHLFSRLQALGLYDQAQYATLMGHRMRWKISFNAREAFHFMELRTAPQGHPAYRALVKTMHEQLSEIHPLTGGAMKFVNQDEDAALTRLAAERYTQFKLNQLGQ